jgi:hypothetical protein
VEEEYVMDEGDGDYDADGGGGGRTGRCPAPAGVCRAAGALAAAQDLLAGGQAGRPAG